MLPIAEPASLQLARRSYPPPAVAERRKKREVTSTTFFMCIAPVVSSGLKANRGRKAPVVRCCKCKRTPPSDFLESRQRRGAGKRTRIKPRTPGKIASADLGTSSVDYAETAATSAGIMWP